MQNELKILGHRSSPWHGHCKKSLNVTYILAEFQYVAQNIAGVIEKEKDSPRKIKLYPTLMLGLCILLSFFDMAVAISFELGEFSFMWTGHDQRACHSPWMEPVFRATDSHNHTNPHKPPSAWALCCQGHRLPQKKKKTIWRGRGVLRPLVSERIWKAGSLFSLIFIWQRPSRRRDVTTKTGLPGRLCGIKLIYACIQGR